MKSCLLFLALMLQLLCAWAGQQSLATINDASGDDKGAGSLVYPQRADFQTGDLDLLHLQINRDEEGFWLEAKFKNPVRDPASNTYMPGPEPLSNFARKGFYQFNLDIYVDTDRIPGSGNTFTLPGRQIRINSNFAWERAVILTPRPELMRQQLLGALTEQFPQRTSDEIAASIDQSVYFPTRIRVRDKTVSFFVPGSFFSGSDGTNWGVTAFVTGALTTIPADFSFISSNKKPLDSLQLGVMQPAPGHQKNTFGYSGIRPSPVVDILGLSLEQQAQQLANNEISGVSWGDNANNVAAASAAVARSSTLTSTVIPLGNLLQPRSQETGKLPQENPATASPSGKASIARRLQTLQQLFDQKLINETEFKQQKQRILEEL